MTSKTNAKAPPRSTPSEPDRKHNTKPKTKIATIVGLLQRGNGATLQELNAASGWQPHSTRAALTGLRKKGHVIEKSKRDDATCYRITGEG